MVEQHDHDFLVVEVLHAGTQVFVGIVAARDFETLVKLLLLVASCQFQGSEDFDGLDLADAVVVLHQVIDALACDEVEFVVIVTQDALAQVHDRLARCAHPEQDSQQLGGGQVPEAVFLGLLARTVFLGNRLLDVPAPHRPLYNISFLLQTRLIESLNY